MQGRLRQKRDPAVLPETTGQEAQLQVQDQNREVTKEELEAVSRQKSKSVHVFSGHLEEMRLPLYFARIPLSRVISASFSSEKMVQHTRSR
jgi:hypothetical protein